MLKKISAAICVCFAMAMVAAGEYSWKINTGGKSVFKMNEKIVFSGQLLKNGKPAIGSKVKYVLLGDNNLKKNGTFVVGEKPWTHEMSLAYPGWVHIKFSVLDAKNKEVKEKVKYRGKMVNRSISSGIGVLVAPEKLLPAKAEPADFDKFWDGVKKELASVPLKELERVPVSVNSKSVKIFDVKVACAGIAPVSAYLTMPAKTVKKGHPAIVIFHGAGVVSARKQIDYGKMGFIALDVNAHGIVNGRESSFYQELRKNKYYPYRNGDKNDRYAHWGKSSRDEFYFRGMYMRVMRALQYVKSLPEWDGKNLVVAGTSQGGAQVIAACGLDQDITLARAGVPAMNDHSGVLSAIPRSSGWPGLYNRTADGKPDDPAVAECAAYFDGCYFARRIKCPIYISTGLLDTVCVPTSVYAAYNSLPEGTEKHMFIDPRKGHSGVVDRKFTAKLNEVTGKRK